jgi:hypothetical protein
MKVPETIETAAEALALVRERGALPLTPVGASDSLAERVAGVRVQGSWCDHPASARIVALSAALEASPEVLTLKLVGGKVTFLHSALWPALLRVARDPARLARVRAGLSPAAARLLDEVEREGEAHLDQLGRQNSWPPERDLARAGKELEAGLLAHLSTSASERGRQALVVRSWARVLPATAHRRAQQLSFEAALETLRSHGAALAPSSGAAGDPRARTTPARPPRGRVSGGRS